MSSLLNHGGNIICQIRIGNWWCRKTLNVGSRGIGEEIVHFSKNVGRLMLPNLTREALKVFGYRHELNLTPGGNSEYGKIHRGKLPSNSAASAFTPASTPLAACDKYFRAPTKSFIAPSAVPNPNCARP